MSTATKLKKLILPGLAAAALTAAASGPAFSSTLSANGAVYAVQSVVSANGALTYTKGGVAGEVLTYTTGAATAAATPAGNFNVVFTLPSGITVTTGTVTATVTPTGATCVANTALPGTVSTSGAVQSISFTVTTTATGAAGDTCAVTLNTFSVSGATALEGLAGLNTITYTAQLVSEVNASFPVDGAPVGPTAFMNSISGLVFTSGGPATAGFGTPVIDVGSAGLGKKFKQGGTDSLVLDDGNLTIAGIAGLVQQDGATPFAIGIGGISVAITGNFNNIATAFLTALAPAASGSTPCGTTGTPPSGATSGTVTPTSITFPALSLGVPAANTIAEVCFVASGTGVIGANVAPANPQAAATVGTTTQKATAQALLAYNYNGAVQQILYGGNFAAYPGFVRITNNTGASATTIVNVQPDNGSTAGTATETVAGNNNVLIPTATIITAAGVTLDPTGRVSMLFLTPGAVCNNNGGGVTCSVSVSQLTLSPNGDLVPTGSGASP